MHGRAGQVTELSACGGGDALLYTGLGMVSVGLAFIFIGAGDKGFKTIELQLVGPCVLGGGVVLVLLRVVLCTLHPCGRGWGEGRKSGQDNVEGGENGRSNLKTVLTVKEMQKTQGETQISDLKGCNRDSGKNEPTVHEQQEKRALPGDGRVIHI